MKGWIFVSTAVGAVPVQAANIDYIAPPASRRAGATIACGATRLETVHSVDALLDMIKDAQAGVDEESLIRAAADVLADRLQPAPVPEAVAPQAAAAAVEVERKGRRRKS